MFSRCSSFSVSSLQNHFPKRKLNTINRFQKWEINNTTRISNQTFIATSINRNFNTPSQFNNSSILNISRINIEPQKKLKFYSSKSSENSWSVKEQPEVKHLEDTDQSFSIEERLKAFVLLRDRLKLEMDRYKKLNKMESVSKTTNRIFEANKVILEESLEHMNENQNLKQLQNLVQHISDAFSGLVQGSFSSQQLLITIQPVIDLILSKRFEDQLSTNQTFLRLKLQLTQVLSTMRSHNREIIEILEDAVSPIRKVFGANSIEEAERLGFIAISIGRIARAQTDSSSSSSSSYSPSYHPSGSSGDSFLDTLDSYMDMHNESLPASLSQAQTYLQQCGQILEKYHTSDHPKIMWLHLYFQNSLIEDVSFGELSVEEYLEEKKLLLQVGSQWLERAKDPDSQARAKRVYAEHLFETGVCCVNNGHEEAFPMLNTALSFFRSIPGTQTQYIACGIHLAQHAMQLVDKHGIDHQHHDHHQHDESNNETNQHQSNNKKKNINRLKTNNNKKKQQNQQNQEQSDITTVRGILDRFEYCSQILQQTVKLIGILIQRDQASSSSSSSAFSQPSLSNPRFIAQAILAKSLLGNMYDRVSKHDQASPLHRGAQDLLQGEHEHDLDDLNILNVQTFYGWHQYRCGHVNQALSTWQHIIDETRAKESTMKMTMFKANVEEMMGNALYDQGYLVTSKEHLEKAVNFYERIENNAAERIKPKIEKINAEWQKKINQDKSK